MSSNRIYDIGAMIGLKYNEIQYLLSEKSMSVMMKNPVKPCSPMDTYKNDGSWYGTISIKDFQ